MTIEQLSLEEVLPKLKDEYDQWKTHESAKNLQKERFFSLANAEVADKGLQMKVLDVKGDTEAEALEWAKRHHPGWIVDAHRPHSWKKLFEVIMVEDPAFKPFTIVHEGIKYSRTVSKGPVMLDDEWLKAHDTELYERVTFELPWGERIVKPFDRMDKEDMAKLSPYIYNDKPRVALAAPKEAKDEDA